MSRASENDVSLANRISLQSVQSAILKKLVRWEISGRGRPGYIELVSNIEQITDIYSTRTREE